MDTRWGRRILGCQNHTIVQVSMCSVRRDLQYSRIAYIYSFVLTRDGFVDAAAVYPKERSERSITL